LFPEKLVESELGLIPEGWEPKQLKDVLELAYGKALKKTDRVAGDVPVYGSGGLTGYHNQSLVEGPGIIVGRKGTVGSVYWEPKAFYPIDTV
ncbi:restriction endonuclease subunit S, partial [Vibrio crassostreae]